MKPQQPLPLRPRRTDRLVLAGALLLGILAVVIALQFIRRDRSASPTAAPPGTTRSDSPGHPGPAAPRTRPMRGSMAETLSPSPSAITLLAALPFAAQYICDAEQPTTAEELEALVTTGQSPNWIITSQRPRSLVIKPRHNAETMVMMHTYKKGRDTVILIQRNHRQTTQTVTWIYDHSQQRAARTDLLPEIKLDQFYSAKDLQTIPEDYKGTIYTSVNDDGSVGYWVHTWMESTLEHIRPAYEISAAWDGERFAIRKTAIADPEPETP